MEKIYICKHCHNVVEMIEDKGVPIYCCHEKMTEIIPNQTDAANEKHVPVYEINGNRIEVTVGSVEHPMTPEHYIEWIALETNQGCQRKKLKPDDQPKVCFSICDDDQVQAVYAFCNLHSLWKG